MGFAGNNELRSCSPASCPEQDLADAELRRLLELEAEAEQVEAPAAH